MCPGMHRAYSPCLGSWQIGALDGQAGRRQGSKSSSWSSGSPTGDPSTCPSLLYSRSPKPAHEWSSPTIAMQRNNPRPHWNPLGWASRLRWQDLERKPQLFFICRISIHMHLVMQLLYPILIPSKKWKLCTYLYQLLILVQVRAICF